MVFGVFFDYNILKSNALLATDWALYERGRATGTKEPFRAARSDLSPSEACDQGISAGYKAVTRVPLGISLPDRDTRWAKFYSRRIYPGGVK